VIKIAPINLIVMKKLSIILISFISFWIIGIIITTYIINTNVNTGVHKIELDNVESKIVEIDNVESKIVEMFNRQGKRHIKYFQRKLIINK